MSWDNEAPKKDELLNLSWDSVPPDKDSPSIAESGVRAFAEGASAGFTDELSGALEAGGRMVGLGGLGKNFGEQSLEDPIGFDADRLSDIYGEQRDEYRRKLHADKAANPLTSATGNIVGAVTSPINRIGKGLSFAKQGAVLGGIGGLGLSEGEDFGEVAIDTATGAAFGSVIGKGAEKASGFAQSGAKQLAKFIEPPRMKANSQEIIDAAEALGIKVTPGMLDDSGFVERLESVLAKSPSFLGRHVARNQRNVTDKLVNATESTLIDAGNSSPYQLGEKVKSGITAKVGERLDPLKAIFDDVAESTKNIPVGDRSKAAIQRNIESIPEFRLTDGAGKPRQYVDMLSRIKTVDEVKTVMTLLNKDIQAAQGAEKQTLLAIKDKLSRLEQNSTMRGAIQSARENGQRGGKELGAGLVDDLRSARSGYRQLSEDLSGVAENARLKTQHGPSAFLDSVEAIPSERIPDKFFNLENNRQLQTLQKNFPEEFELLKQGRLKDIRDAAVDNSLNGQGNISPQRFLNEVRGLNPEARQMLFGDKASIIDDVQTVQRSLPRNFNPSGTASEGGWTDAVYRNVKDIPTFMLYKGASSNLAGNISRSLLKSPQMAEVYRKNPALFQNMVNQLEQKAGIVESAPQIQNIRQGQEQNEPSASIDKDSIMQKASGSKYQQVLQNAANRNDNSFAAAHYVLANQDEEYRKLIGQ